MDWLESAYPIEETCRCVQCCVVSHVCGAMVNCGMHRVRVVNLDVAMLYICDYIYISCKGIVCCKSCE